MQKIKRRFLRTYTSGLMTVKQAAAKVNRSDRTIQRWAKEDEEFAAAYEKAKEEQHARQLGAVETALVQRILRGLDHRNDSTISASLIIFWLKANGGDRYRLADKQYLHHSGGIRSEGEQKHTGNLEVRIERYRGMLSGAAGGEAGEAAAPAGDGAGADSNADS